MVAGLRLAISDHATDRCYDESVSLVPPAKSNVVDALPYTHFEVEPAAAILLAKIHRAREVLVSG